MYRLLRQAEEFRRLLEEAVVESEAALARRVGVSRARVAQVMAVWRLHRPVLEHLRAMASSGARCDARGALLLEGVEVSAWQAINLPRIWDDPERDEDPPPDHELERMFARVRGALYAWLEALDHLRPTPPRS